MSASLLLGAALLIGGVATERVAPRDLSEVWRWTRFDTADGLASNRVYQIVDLDHEAWALTVGGACVFDGLRWSKGPFDGLIDGRPRAIAAAGDGRCVYVVSGGGLYLGTSAGFELLTEEVPPRFGEALGVVALSPQRAFVQSLGEGEERLWLLDLEQHTWIEVEPTRPTQGNNPSRLWPGAGESVFRWDGQALHRWQDDIWTEVLAITDVPVRVQRVLTATDGTAILLVHGGALTGIWEWREGGRASLVRREGSLPLGADVTAEGELLVTYPSGDARLRRVDGGWSDLFALPGMTSLPYTLAHRANGDLWVGTDSGVYLHRASSHRWQQLRRPSPDVTDHVLSVVVARDGSLWKGTPEGLHVVHPDGSEEWIGEILGASIGVVTALAQDGAGNIWIGSGSAFTGVYRFDGQGWTFHGEESMGACYVHRIRTDRAGRAWFCTLRTSLDPGGPGPGPFVHDEGRLTLVPFEGLRPARVYDFAESPNGDQWFGTSQGLRRLRDGEWTTWERGNQLRRSIVAALALDPAGRPWFCHNIEGLGVVDEDDVVRYDPGIAAGSEVPLWSLAFDHSGALWLATSDGVACVRGGHWSWQEHHTPLAGARTWSIQPHGDEVYFGTLGVGVVVLDTGDRAELPSIDLSSPLVAQDRVHAEWRPVTAWGNLPSAVIETRWRLDDGPFSAWSLEHEVDLRSLEPGVHELWVQAKGPFADVDPIGSRARFTVPAPWFTRAVFLVPSTLGGLFLLLAVGALWRRRARHRAMQQRLSEQFLRAEKLEAIGRLSGGIAHDFNNLLTTIIGNTALIRMTLDERPDAELSEFVTEIEAATGRATEMTGKLLAVGRSDDEEATDSAPDEVLTGMRDMLRRLLREDVKLMIQPGAPDERIAMGPGSLERVVLNLALNGADAMPEGGELRIETAREGDQVQLRVIDDGVGMDEETRHRVFEPFFTTKPVGEGSGLGLASVRGLVVDAGGTLEVHSAPLVGTTFVVSLPIHDAAVAAGDDPAGACEDLLGGIESILVCEDDVAVRSFVRSLLERHGYAVCEAGNGREALRTIEDHGGEIDMIISDVIMPEMTGRGLVAELEEGGHATKVLLVSGHEFDEASGSVPDQAFLRKPFSTSELLSKVRTMLDTV